MRSGAGRSGTTGFVTGVLSLRGLLALLVATSHTVAFTITARYSASIFDQPDLVATIAKAVSDGIYAPMIFFVISGLAIARSLERKDDLGQPVTSYFTFIIRRALRLYPAHTLSTFGVIGLASLFLIDPEPIDISLTVASGVGFTSEWFNGAVFNPLKLKSLIGNFAIATWSMNPVVWSLFVEVCVIPILPLMHRVVREKNLATDITMLAGLVVMSGLMWNHLGMRYCFAFHLGMLVQSRGRSVARSLSRLCGGCGRASLLAWLVLLVPLAQPPDWMAATFIQGAGAFAIVSLVVWGENETMSRLLDRPVLRWNGRMSYSFYLWHYILLTVTVRELYVHFPLELVLAYDLPILAAVEVSTIGAALAIAQFSYSFVEEPCIRFGTRLENWLRQALHASVPVAAGLKLRG
jgi:peptidoglycan/LPS O-acetylase OafA/YrhL